MRWLWIVLAYWAVMNLLGLWLCFLDKYKARKQSCRIPEKTLLGVCAIGGAVGLWAGMYLFRHKTKHLSFVLFVPLCSVIQIALLVWLFIQNWQYI